jgi:gas vesicle protein
MVSDFLPREVLGLQMSGFLKGVGVGAAVGAALTAALIPADRKRLLRSRAGRTLRAIGHAVEDLV